MQQPKANNTENVNSRILSISITKRIVLHILFWLFYVLFFGSIYGKYGNNYSWYLMESCCMLPFVMLATYTTIYVLLPWYLKKRKLVLTVCFVVLLLFVVTLGERYFLRRLNNLPVNLDSLFGIPTLYLMLETNFMVASAFTIKILKKWFEYRQKEYEVEKRNLQSELDQLKAQLHPHFLFNAMNNLYALSVEESSKTSEGIARISDLLRSVLYDCNEAEYALEKEIKLIENFINLERMRYEESLNIQFQVKGIIENKKIAPMILFTFVENCFKHGIGSVSNNAVVSIQLDVSENEIIFFAENNKAKKEEKAVNETQSGGIGLVNVRKRLEIIYGKNFMLDIKNKADTFLVSLIIKK